MKTMEGLQKHTISKEGRGESGITLIALVITIILLLILATISIAVVTGDNGIISKAREAKELTEQAEEKEQIILAYNAAVTIKYADGNYNPKVGITAEELNVQLEKQEAGATAAAPAGGDNTGLIEVTFAESENEYTVDPIKGTTTFVEPTPGT